MSDLITRQITVELEPHISAEIVNSKLVLTVKDNPDCISELSVKLGCLGDTIYQVKTWERTDTPPVESVEGIYVFGLIANDGELTEWWVDAEEQSMINCGAVDWSRDSYPDFLDLIDELEAVA